jgi:hypothetical protein
VSSSSERDLSRAHLAHQHQHHRDETLRPVVCATRARCRRCALLAFVNEPDGWQQQPLVRRASVMLAAALPDTSDDQRDARLAHWLCTRAVSAVAVAHARVLRRPNSRDEFELALGEAMTTLQLGNSRSGASARHERWRRGGATLWPGTRALAIRTREAYGAERFNEARNEA